MTARFTFDRDPVPTEPTASYRITVSLSDPDPVNAHRRAATVAQMSNPGVWLLTSIEVLS